MSPIAPHLVPSVTPEVLAEAPERTVVDLRSPGEFAQDHVPGAASVPLFGDVERAVVGTLYARESPAAAFEEGRRATRARIGRLVAEIAGLARRPVPAPADDLEALVLRMTAGGIESLERELATSPVAALPPGALVLTCWRGGLRSRSVAALLRRVGFAGVHVLEGGYKAYRAWVRARLAAWEAPPTVVLRGLTGVGKTLVLRAVETLAPGTTLDLEGLAGHRSSILGRVGLEPCSQRTFDSRLVERLERGFAGPCLVEGESRKVGDVILPPSVWKAVDEGVAVELVATRERRVAVLVADYLATERSRAELLRELPFLEERLGPRAWRGELVRRLEEGRDEELCELLLEHYYDPLYRRSEAGRAYAARIEAGDPRAAAEEVLAFARGRAGAAPRALRRASGNRSRAVQIPDAVGPTSAERGPRP